MARTHKLKRKTTGDCVVFIIMTLLAIIVALPFYLSIVTTGLSSSAKQPAYQITDEELLKRLYGLD